jgi:ABC-type Fe3+/spermidine/putrescine transport system ATPase subunit
MIAGFEEPTSGDVFLGGERINGKRPYGRDVGTVFQSYALFPHLTVRGNIETDRSPLCRPWADRLSVRQRRRPALIGNTRFGNRSRYSSLSRP